MEMTSRAKIRDAAAAGEDVPGRIVWLSGFCRLMPLEAELLSLLAGLYREPPPDPDGWPLSALAARLAAEPHAVAATLQPLGPLCSGGLVRVSMPAGDEPRVALNERIERFLFAPPRTRV